MQYINIKSNITALNVHMGEELHLNSCEYVVYVSTYTQHWMKRTRVKKQNILLSFYGIQFDVCQVVTKFSKYMVVIFFCKNNQYIHNFPHFGYIVCVNDEHIVGLEQERAISQNKICQKWVIDCILSSTSNSTAEKFPASKFAPFTPFLSGQKLSLLHQLGYRRFPLEQERTRCSWCSGCSERRVNASSNNAPTRLSVVSWWKAGQ